VLPEERGSGVKEDKAYSITIVINEHPNKRARYHRIHVTREIVDDEASFGALLAMSAKKMINDLDQNDWARLDEVDEDGESTMVYHYDIEDSTEVRIVKKTLD
jgi:hypothetical protein